MCTQNQENGYIALDDHFRALGEEFYSLYQLLQPIGPIRVEMTPSQQSKFNNYFSSVQTSQMNTHGEYIIASVRRLGLSAFRIILILSALRILETGEILTKLICTDEDFSTALTICNSLMVHTGKIFSTLPQVEETPSGPSLPPDSNSSSLPCLKKPHSRAKPTCRLQKLWVFQYLLPTDILTAG